MNPGSERQSMDTRWRALAAEIAAAADQPLAEGPRGKLIVIGSGMAHMDFTRDSDAEIRAADFVFHCVYDRVTQAWIGRLRPDAYDLRALYSPTLDRYYTYIRMAEALLHHVRRGARVVAIYYGHPGIFAMPAHRAIHLARREGHTAIMRPGVSALDYLVADLGFDPALPGLMTYEATDMLLRRRRIDPTLHVVLWQVGVVGEFQFAPAGFANHGFALLVDVLEAEYGPDWEITHYIAPQYVGVEPLIERIPVSRLREDEVRARISSLSTFYIEPMLAAPTDADRSITLGLTHAGQPAAPPERGYDFMRDTELERRAVRGLADFGLPDHYHVAAYTPAVEFMLQLTADLDLQARYRADPVALLADPQFDWLGERARKLLAIPHPRAIAAAIAEPAPDEDPVLASEAA